MSQLETSVLPHRLNDDALDVIFRTARTYNGWLDKPVSDETLQEVYDLMKWGANQCERKPRPIPAPADESGKRATASSTRARQCGEDHGCARHRDCRL
jgi:3-hydroxypropanoate dehydrogenase